jgi:hypothetical protein
MQLSSYKNINVEEHLLPFKQKQAAYEGYNFSLQGSFKTFL